MKEGTPTVRWGNKNHFEERRMRFTDWQRFGAKFEARTEDESDEKFEARLRKALDPASDTVWSQANGWTVERSKIPLSDEQLQEFFSHEQAFSLDKAPAQPLELPSAKTSVPGETFTPVVNDPEVSEGRES